MKNLIFILTIILFTSCEEVIDVSLDTAEPRLVVEASIEWKTGTNGANQKIKLSTTTGYFNPAIPAVTNAVVYITNSNNQQFDFVQETTPGTYVCNNFIPVLNENYTLTVVYNGNTYRATEKLLNTPLVKRVEQTDGAGFLGDEIELKFVFDDIVNETNYYLIKVNDPNIQIPQYGVLEDRFFQNNEMFGLYFSDKLKTGDQVLFSLNGISRNYYNYMNILLAQTGTNSAGPFSTPNSTVRGNIVNQTNFDTFALGYFRLSKTDVVTYTVQ